MNSEQGLLYFDQAIEDFHRGRLKSLILMDGDNVTTKYLVPRLQVRYLSIQKFIGRYPNKFVSYVVVGPETHSQLVDNIISLYLGHLAARIAGSDYQIILVSRDHFVLNLYYNLQGILPGLRIIGIRGLEWHLELDTLLSGGPSRHYLEMPLTEEDLKIINQLKPILNEITDINGLIRNLSNTVVTTTSLRDLLNNLEATRLLKGHLEMRGENNWVWVRDE
ncbi:Hypothetical protein HVR_LOCUS578 [uncultured virus]|nr:Hypothetical protein HVR_LOCUS578 [uncultured virus]